MERNDGLGPGRLVNIAMLGIEPKDMDILRPGLIEVSSPAKIPTISLTVIIPA